MYGFAGVSVPDDRGLSLIGHSDCSDLAPAFGSGLFGCADLSRPDGSRVMFDPPEMWEDLGELLLCRPHWPAFVVE